MRYCLLFSIVMFSLACKAQYVTGDFQNTSFRSVVSAIEKQTGAHVYYNPLWTDSLVINYNANQKTPGQILEAVLTETGLHVTIVSQNIYITKDRTLLTTLPAGFNPQDTSRRQKQTDTFDYSEYERKEKLRKLAETRLYLIGNKNSPPAGNATLAGTIRDASNGEPVIGASLYITETGTGASTDQFGYYSIRLPKGRHEMTIKSIGMKSTQRDFILYSDGKLDADLDPDVTPLKEVVIESERDAKITSAQMGLERLDIHTMRQMPLALGETDIMKVVLALPGVQSVGEGTVGLNVRGGASNQNLITLNDAVIYNPSHLFGFFSTFNPDVLRNVELYKSDIKAQYGGRISSVLDVHTREGNTKKISGSGGISPITGRFSLEGPIIKNKTSFIIGGRSTYSDWILKKLNNKQLNQSKAEFYDITLNISHKINDNNQIFLSAYRSRDYMRLSHDTSYVYSDQNAALKWKHIFNNKLFAVFTGTLSQYKYEMNSDSNPVTGFRMDFNIGQATAKADFNYFLNTKHSVDAGISITGYGLAPGEIQPGNSESKVARDVIQKEHGRESALYIGDSYEISPKILLYGGLRYTLYQYLGPKDVYRYSEGVPRNVNSITDTLHYGGGKPIVSYQGLEPRASIRYTISDKASVKFSYNRMRQYIQMLSNTTALMPTDIWKLSDQFIKPQIGDQYSLGFYKNLKGNNIEFSFETYYKSILRTLDYKNGAVLLLNHHIETDVLEARGKAYGFELMLKKSTGKTNGWISYTYSRSFYKAKGEYGQENVNHGNYYPSNFDKPHAVNFIGNYKFSRRFNLSLNLVYSTGRPITLPIGKYETNGTFRVLYSDRNAYRIPDYFRSDVSINVEGNHKIKKLAHSSWTFAIYNVTGRKNAYSVFFTSDNGVVKSYKLSIFARPIPTITYNFKF
jgi:hypothetical protein